MASLTLGACGVPKSSTAALNTAPASVAIALDRSILGIEYLRAAGIAAVSAPGSGPGPTGPLSLEGVAAHFPIPGADIRGTPATNRAIAGASQRYNIGPAGVPGPILTIIAVDFPTAGSATKL